MNYAVASSQLCPNSYNPRSYSSSQNTVENRRGQRTHHPARRLSNRIGGANNLPVGSRWPPPTLPLQPRHQRQSRNGPRLPPATAAMASRMNRREHPGPNQSAAASSSTAGLVRNQPRWTASPSPRRVRRCCRRPDFPLFFHQQAGSKPIPARAESCRVSNPPRLLQPKGWAEGSLQPK